jgi:hypothetical protein
VSLAQSPPAITAVIDGQPAELPSLFCELPDGRIGWYQRSEFDCLQAAVATAVGAPYEALEGVRSLKILYTWAALNGFTVEMLFEGSPDQDSLWIGHTPVQRLGMRHAFVGRGENVYFDPASGWIFPGGHPLPPRVVDYATQLKPKEQQ